MGAGSVRDANRNATESLSILRSTVQNYGRGVVVALKEDCGKVAGWILFRLSTPSESEMGHDPGDQGIGSIV